MRLFFLCLWDGITGAMVSPVSRQGDQAVGDTLTPTRDDAPAGKTVEWIATITEDRPGEV